MLGRALDFRLESGTEIALFIDGQPWSPPSTQETIETVAAAADATNTIVVTNPGYVFAGAGTVWTIQIDIEAVPGENYSEWTSVLSADFTNANLTAASLRNVDLTTTNLAGANLSRCDLRGANLSDCRGMADFGTMTIKWYRALIDSRTRFPTPGRRRTSCRCSVTPTA